MSQFCQKSNMTKNCFNLKDAIAGTALMAVNGCSSNSNLSEAPEVPLSSAPQDENVFVKKTNAPEPNSNKWREDPVAEVAAFKYAENSLKTFQEFKPKEKLDFKNYESHEDFGRIAPKLYSECEKRSLTEWVKQYLSKKNKFKKVFFNSDEDVGRSCLIMWEPSSCPGQENLSAISMAVNYTTKFASMIFYFRNGLKVEAHSHCFKLGTGSELQPTILDWFPWFPKKWTKEKEEEDGVTLDLSPIEWKS
eukprot:GHVP01060644.1.p1 GENE.GHVP01060644.1~~GHVP01060644.1.p1  ORF type:complete len:249 (+),score=50.52 GHVP01060644.1:733-1479(+)